MKHTLSLISRFGISLLLLFALCMTASCFGTVGGNGVADDNPSSSRTDGNETSKNQDGTQNDPSADTYVTIRLFKDGKAVSDEQSIKAGNRLYEPTYTLTDNAAYTYTLIGWDADGDGEAETFPYTVTKDTEFHLLYTKTEKKYTVEIYDNGVLCSSASLAYGDEITYPTLSSYITPEENAFIFRGWSYDGVYDGYYYPYATKSVRIDASYIQGRVLKLQYGAYLYTMIKADGDSLDFAADFDLSATEGKIIHYYTDDAYLTPFVGTAMPESNLTIYAREESVDDTVPTNHVTSREALLGSFAEKLLNRETKMEFSLDYTEEDTLDDLIAFLKNGSVTYTGYQISSSLASSILSLEIEYPKIATVKSGDPLYTQIKSLNVTPHTPTRSATTDNFAADAREIGFPVKNSDALYYALEHGYRPDIDGDAVDVIALYNTMKIFLRDAVSDDMTDLEKVRAIYEKLILDTVYDTAVLNKVTAGEADLTKYRAFYLEGVFLDHLAVCDGISKAFASLCQMEGITCIRVSGRTVEGDGPHAWNKVKLGENYYVVDATAGGTILGDREVLSYAYFLLSDAAYAAHATEDGKYYPDVHCPASYPFFDTLKAKIGSADYALTVNSAQAGGELLCAIMALHTGCDVSLDVCLAFAADTTADAVSAILQAADIPMTLRYATSLGHVILIIHP